MSGVSEPELRHVGLTLEGVPPLKRAQVESDVFGFWAFLMSDALIFALLFAIYATMIGRYAGGPTPGQEFKFHSAFWETALLLTSSFTYGGVSIALKHDAKRRWIVLFTAITFCLGAYFVRMECHEFTTMFHDGATPEHSGYLSSFFVLVAMHGFHVTCGLIWMLLMGAQMAIHGIDQRVKVNFVRLGLFWHFLDIVWVCIFTIVYLHGLQR
jgi:cytochrome o ubiquinol oxidase subunit III